MLDKKVALILLTEMEMLRQTQASKNSNEDFLVKSCQAITALSAGFISRLEWVEPVKAALKQNANFHARLQEFKEWEKNKK